MEIFHVSRSSVQRVWTRALANYFDPHVRSFNASPKRKGACGRNLFWDREQIRQEVTQLSLHQRRTIRGLTHVLRIPKTTLHRMKQDKDDPVIRPVTIALKPFLTEQHKLLRVLYCCENLDRETRLYNSFYNHVHIDEKWFFVCKQD